MTSSLDRSWRRIDGLIWSRFWFQTDGECFETVLAACESAFVLKAKMHAARSNDLQEILSEEALQKLQLCFGKRNLMPVKFHDLVCKDCRKEASRSAAAPSSVPSRRSEAMDLVATSPITTAETAIALQFALPLSRLRAFLSLTRRILGSRALPSR